MYAIVPLNIKALYILAFMMSQKSFIWLEYAQLCKNEQKETKNSIVETT